MSIWNGIAQAGTSRLAAGQAPIRRELGVGDLKGKIDGTFGRGSVMPAGRHVVNGVPYGTQLMAEGQDMDDLYRLQPAKKAKLRAATRAALRR